MTHSPESVDSDTFVLSIRGLRITARRTGSGDPLLLLNGLSRPMESWTDFAGALRGRIVITLDGPGVGASETPIVPYSMPMLSDIAARVLDAVGIEKADIVGFSHGGVVAQQFAVGHPARVNRLVLLSTSCGVGAVPGRARDATRILLAPNRATQWPRPDPLGLLWQLAAISTWSSIPVLGCIDAPTLVICGDHDTAVPPANSGLKLRRASATSALSRSAKARPGGRCRPAGGAVSRFGNFGDGLTLPVDDDPSSNPATNYRRSCRPKP